MLVVSILLGIAALLAVPVGVAFRLERVEAFSARVDVRWLFGLVRVRVRVPRDRARPPRREGEVGGERPRRAARVAPRRIAGVLRDRAFRRRVERLVRDIVRAAHLDALRLRMRLGLGDPADTGRLWAVVGPLGAAARGLRGADVRLEPEFVDPVLELHARGRAVLVPLQLLALAVSFALSPPALRAWRAVRADGG